VSLPLVWFPRLLTASPKQRKDWELIGGGIGFHWEAKEAITSPHLIAGTLSPPSKRRLRLFQKSEAKQPEACTLNADNVKVVLWTSLTESCALSLVNPTADYTLSGPMRNSFVTVLPDCLPEPSRRIRVESTTDEIRSKCHPLSPKCISRV
jgi:hypothetical protein